jgi:hypothetical protein
VWLVKVCARAKRDVSTKTTGERSTGDTRKPQFSPVVDGASIAV